MATNQPTNRTNKQTDELETNKLTDVVSHVSSPDWRRLISRELTWESYPIAASHLPAPARKWPPIWRKLIVYIRTICTKFMPQPGQPVVVVPGLYKTAQRILSRGKVDAHNERDRDKVGALKSLKFN